MDLGDVPPYEDISDDAMHRLTEQAASWDATVSAVRGWREVDIPRTPPADDLPPIPSSVG